MRFFSDLVNYCEAAKFKDFEESKYCEDWKMMWTYSRWEHEWFISKIIGAFFTVKVCRISPHTVHVFPWRRASTTKPVLQYRVSFIPGPVLALPGWTPLSGFYFCWHVLVGNWVCFLPKLKILGHQFDRRLESFAPCYSQSLKFCWRILTTTLFFSGFKNAYKINRETRKALSIHEKHFCRKKK